MEPSTKVAIGIAAGITILLGCCVGALALPFVGCNRSFVVQPELDVLVRSADGPLNMAEVEHVWWSDPHGNVHATSTDPVRSDGRIVFAKRHEQERVMPLCMHGVPFHQHQFCVDAPGYQPVGFLVRDLELPVTGEIVLEPGEGECTGQVGFGDRLPTTSVSNADTFTIR